MRIPSDETQLCTIEVARNREQLLERVSEWDELAASAEQDNVFYESGPLLTALQHLSDQQDLCCVFVYPAGESDSQGPRRLLGFFPFVRVSKGPFGLLRCYGLVNHIHCFLCTPLVRCGEIALALEGLRIWMNSVPDGVRVFGFHKYTGDGALGEQLTACLLRNQQGLLEFAYGRAFLRRAENAVDYIDNALTTKKRKEYRRLRRRLEALGDLSLTTTYDDIDWQWAHAFFDMELAGWKRETGFAMANTQAGIDTFYGLLDYLGNQRRLLLHTLSLNGEPIAMKINLLTHDRCGAFAFKIAYDEQYSKYSPGVLLELENIRDLHQREGLDWMDSCADPDHPMIDHLWRERRSMNHVVCASRGFIGWALMLVFRLRHKLRKKRLQKQLESASA